MRLRKNEVKIGTHKAAERSKKFVRRGARGVEKTHTQKAGGQEFLFGVVRRLKTSAYYRTRGGPTISLEIRFGGRDGLRYFPNDKVVYHFFFSSFCQAKIRLRLGVRWGLIAGRMLTVKKKKSRAAYKVHVRPALRPSPAFPRTRINP